MIRFTVNGVPKGQPRPRAFSRGGHARVYDPGTAEGWKSAVALAARPHLPPSPMEGPVLVELLLFMPRPKSRCRKCDPDGVVWCEAKPDCDNAAKAVLDALTVLGMWRDDAQVVSLLVAKAYHAKGGRPGAVVTITPATVVVSSTNNFLLAPGDPARYNPGVAAAPNQ